MTKEEYLEFESRNIKNMSLWFINWNRRKYGITNEDIVKFYGNNDPIYLK